MASWARPLTTAEIRRQFVQLSCKWGYSQTQRTRLFEGVAQECAALASEDDYQETAEWITTRGASR